MLQGIIITIGMAIISVFGIVFIAFVMFKLGSNPVRTDDPDPHRTRNFFETPIIDMVYDFLEEQKSMK